MSGISSLLSAGDAGYWSLPGGWRINYLFTERVFGTFIYLSHTSCEAKFLSQHQITIFRSN